ncbi:unnamed protein product [Toxocara canis]|uniref:Uncharacterized protein n=1 Tax=Toxocara canis TaxID=6265 RepID=A0A183UKA0_TOXCA|nr:unnamed protein product [Toxocara canis]
MSFEQAEQPPTPQPDYSFGHATGERLQQLQNVVNADDVGEAVDVEEAVLPMPRKFRNFIGQTTFQPTYFAAGIKSIYDEEAVVEPPSGDDEVSLPEKEETSEAETTEELVSNDEPTTNEQPPFELGKVHV